MNETSFSSLEEVVFCFYQSNNIRQSEAQKFLMELENSPQVWEIIWNELLSSKVRLFFKNWCYGDLLGE